MWAGGGNVHGNQRVMRELRRAAARGEIIAEYQAQVDATSGRAVAVEALSRWRHPERGMLGPQHFIPIAEETRSMDAVGDAMIRAACRYGAELAGSGRPLEVAVNVAAVQLEQPHFAERVLERLAHAGLSAWLLTLELTEARPSPATAGGTLDRVRAHGVGVSLDDVRTLEEAEFRTGVLPITELKVDRSVIERLPGDDGTAARLVRFARERGLRTVAEGVETERQWEAVRKLGFDRAQGFLFGRPTPPERMTARLRAEADGPDQSEL
ncbi:EAL domain-containing protein [Agromyces sp. NPDC056523]|uniref:EAL domain-containing protein n=1 Tax=Agromyces sp. NPDC056523 TaxID=3345850 RepID=UPI00366DC358